MANAIDPNKITVGSSTLQAWANAFAAEYNIPVDLFSNLIGHESSWNVNAKGQAGEIGLGQVKPSTAGNGVNLVDPLQNMAFSAKYLSGLYAKDGSWSAALQEYNSGSITGNPTYAKQVLAGQDSSGGALPFGQALDPNLGVPAPVAATIRQAIADFGGYAQIVDPATGNVELVGKNQITGATTQLMGGDPLILGPSAFDPSGGGALTSSTAGNPNYTTAAAALTPEQQQAANTADTTTGSGPFAGVNMQNVIIYGAIGLVIVAAVIVGFAVIGRSQAAPAAQPRT